jgi:signal transduction histidine kinase/DNA-binding response OmpR family regulator/sugar lactone lactonase YvrE
MVESDGKIWIGTEGGGLACYDLKTKEYHFFDLDNPNRKNLYSNTIKALAVDKTKTLWIGTYAAGIQTFDIKNRTFGRYYNSLDGIDNNIVNDIFVDHQDNIWVGTNTLNGLHIKEKYRDDFTTGFTIQDTTGRITFPWIRTICETKGNEIWFGSIYYGVFIYENGKSTRRISVENSDLSCDYISTIMEDSRGHIWIGTYGGGVNIYYPETGVIRSFNTDDGLLNNNVCCIIEDSFSTIWISTAAGLSKCNMADYSFVNYSYGKLSFPVEVLNLKSGLLASDGNIYIGGSNGIACFSPERIKNNDFIPAIKATHLYINNRLVQAADGTHILSKSITETSSLTLKYNQTNILIRFAALNYLLPQNNQYMYYLEGYDKQWNKESFQRQVTYTNLPSGKYTLKVKASNNSGIWNETGVSIGIDVLPPPWKTWWAYCLYLLFVTIIIFVIINYFVSRVKMENNIRLKQIEQQAIEEAHQVKLNMFTNFSHELRTPLTLIINPVKEILSDTSLAAIYKESLRLVYRNANRMLLLVNQLLDVRKQEAGAVTIKVKEANLIKFIREIVIIFRELSKSKHIELNFSSGQNVLHLYYDADMLEKVFYNILSNAIKNTPIHAKIDVEVFQASYETVHRDIFADADEGRQIGLADLYIVCNIKDTGKGIPAEDLKKIFTPFFRVDENDLSGIKGTGLGLHIAKTIMEQHHGMIKAFNNPCGGACFQLIFPVNKSLYSDNQIDAMSQPYVVPATGAGEDANAVMTDGDSKKNDASLKILKKDTPIVLIVDDNSDIRLFMSSQLRNDYVVYEAENGETAWEKAQEIVPDLILCDIMMPVMDGLELCTLVKNDLKTCHIPVILLTARSSMLHVEEGLMTGADDYITKPFDAGLLKIRIKNAIENRRKAKDSYLKNFTIDIPTPLSNRMDEAFLSKSYEYVKLNLDNTELNIDAFGKYMCLSRTQLYRKIKALTGKSPSRFVSTLRLKYAAELLATTTLSIQEIADRTGFNNASYFTTSFKKLYGTTPTEYVQSKKTYSQFPSTGIEK